MADIAHAPASVRLSPQVKLFGGGSRWRYGVSIFPHCSILGQEYSGESDSTVCWDTYGCKQLMILSDQQIRRAPGYTRVGSGSGDLRNLILIRTQCRW